MSAQGCVRSRIALGSGALAVVLAIAGCGGGDDSASSGASGASGTSGPQNVAGGDVSVSFAQPQSKSDQVGAELLRAVDVEGLASILSTTFEIPTEIEVKAVNGLGGGPFYNPANDTITYQYGFAALIFNTLKANNPDWSQHKLGFATGSVLAFILEHEFTHALINIYDLPVLGKEEDAADTLATLLLLKSPKGDKLALDAAEFWAEFSGRQDPPAVADYADEHSLDLQRAYTIVCDIAGSNEARYDLVNEADILPKGDIKSCPAQYQQDVESYTQVLDPHVKGELNFQAPSD